MSIPAPISPAILDTVIGRLAVLFLTGAAGDMTVARHAASQMLAAYTAETPDELSLAAQIISLQMHTLEVLGYAADPELTLNKVLRLRGGAVSLSRESHKAQRKLDQLQHARRAGITAPATEALPAQPRIENALSLIEATRDAVQAPRNLGASNGSQSFHKRQSAQRIAENLKNNQARHAALAAHRDAAAGITASAA
jgi:hypothetical protein